ncbi:MAG TPA: DEAD/DEAH box helicase [Candidatus Nanoarchaeia archaeon]|nr:DEAD/DEAH box helicase [Candidatus Nanoarchaeia archaeon]
MAKQLAALKGRIPDQLSTILERGGISELRPSQQKAINAGLLDGQNLLVCTPTASGKTLIAELLMLSYILNRKGTAIYIVPLKALGSEKYREFSERYQDVCRVALSIGDLDSADPYLADYDLIVTTSEKLDSLIRHSAPWLKKVGCVVIDEIHLLNDPDRGPTLEILITMLRELLKNIQLLGLSATIGNPKELAQWLDAKLVQDSWRPVKLAQGIYRDGIITYA